MNASLRHQLLLSCVLLLARTSMAQDTAALRASQPPCKCAQQRDTARSSQKRPTTATRREPTVRRDSGTPRQDVSQRQSDSAKLHRDTIIVAGDEETAHWTKWLFFATLALVGATIGLWVTAFRTLKSSEKGAQIPYRAYVSWHAVESPNNDPTIGRTFTFKNAGRTPAQDVKISVECLVADRSNPQLRPVTHVPESTIGTLVPEQITPPLPVRFPYHMDSVRVAALHLADQSLYVIGLITYRDVFGKLNRLHFRWAMMGSAIVLTGDGNTAEYGIED